MNHKGILMFSVIINMIANILWLPKSLCFKLSVTHFSCHKQTEIPYLSSCKEIIQKLPCKKKSTKMGVIFP